MNKPYKIAIDVRMLDRSGIGRYLSNLLPLLIGSHPEAHFILLGSKKIIETTNRFNLENLTITECQSEIYSINEQWELPRKIARNVDLFWAPHFNLPLFYSGPLLVTIHDTFHLAMPQYVKGLHRRLYARLMFSAVKRKAACVLCNSNFTASEMVKRVHISPSKLRVIYHSVDTNIFNIQKQGQSPHSKPYILFIGNIKPHKNLSGLIQAFYLLKDQIPHDLLIIGKSEGFLTADRHALELLNNNSQSRIISAGVVADEQVPQYLRHAACLVLPSFYEGFGLPPLEAMACGCPAIVSQAASLPEICGDAALYCNPDDPQDIAQKILSLLNSEQQRQELMKKGFEWVKRYNWDVTADQTWQVIMNILSN